MRQSHLQKGELIAVLDIGNHKNACLVARLV